MSIFKWSASLLFLALIVFACEKDKFNPSISDSQGSHGQELTGINSNQEETSAYKLKKELAVGLSSAVSKYPELLELFVDRQKSVSKRLPALTLINNLNREANSLGATLADVLLENAPELQALYQDVNGLEEEIYRVDPLISFKIPSIWYDYDFIAAKSQPVVHAFESKEQTAAFVNGRPVKLEEGVNYFAINVQTSEEHMLVELDKSPGDESIFSYMFTCNAVREHMAEMVELDPDILVDVESPNGTDPVIIVDVFEDVRDVYVSSCLPPAPPPSFSLIMDCDEICKRDCGREDNRLMGFEVSSMAALSEMGSNAPPGQREEFYNFHINFVNADRESPIANRISYYYPFNFSEIVGSVTTVTVGEERCELEWNDQYREWEEDCWIPTTTTTQISLKYVPLNGETGIPVSGFWNPVQNEWNFERYGDVMKVSWQEVDNTFYNSQTSRNETTQRSFQFGISVSAQFKILGASMSSNTSFSHSNSSQTSVSITAASLVQLGDQLIGFCDSPNEEFNPNIYNSGMIKSHLIYFLPE